MTGSSIAAALRGLLGIPVLVGVFIGAPLVAHEFETGTSRFSLTQGISLRRQVTVKLVLIGIAVAVVTSALSLLGGWWSRPLTRLGFGSNHWQAQGFNSTAITLAAWSLLGLCLGVLAGALIRRTRPAMAVAAGAGLVALIAAQPLNAGLLSIAPRPVRSLPAFSVAGDFTGLSKGGTPIWQVPPGQDRRIHIAVAGPSAYPGPHGSWQVGGWFTGPDGHPLGASAAQSIVNHVPLRIALGSSPAQVRHWLAIHHVAYWISSQPASRFWLFQGAAGLVLIALAAVLGFAAVRLVGLRD